MKKLLLLFTVILASVSLYSQTPYQKQEFYNQEWKTFKEFLSKKSAKENTDTTFDIKFYHIKTDVSIDPSAKYIKGNVLCRLEPRVNNLNTIALSLHPSLHVDSITGNSSGFSVIGDSILIVLDNSYNIGQNVEVKVWYQGIPVMAGGYKGLRYEVHHGGEPIIATLSTPFLAHYWYPCKDGPEDKADSVYLDISIPDTVINGNPVIAVSNGLLESIDTVGNKTTYCWRHRYPIVTYYVMMAISNYNHFQQTFSGLEGEVFPIDYYVFSENDSTSQLGVADMPDAMQFFSTKFGKYPFRNERYGMSELGYYGAIENQTNTIINNMSSGWFGIAVHELAHMWFGDMITCSNWHHAWMNEGFATYSEALWEEHKYGFTALKNIMINTQYFSAGTLYLQNDNDTFNIFQPIVYDKGGWALHMLRGVLGDTCFFNCMKNYAELPGYMYKNASTENFRDLCESQCGLDLDFFFNQWIYDERYPVYHYNFRQDTTSKILTLHLFQAQDSISGWRPVFEMPLQIKITDVLGHDTTITVWNDQQTQEFSFQLNELVTHNSTSVKIDPDYWVLREIVFKPLLPVVIDESATENQDLILSPNPATDQLTVQHSSLNDYKNYSILDIRGKVVKTGFLKKGSIHIPLQNIPSGVYFFRITDEKHEITRQFIKQ